MAGLSVLLRRSLASAALAAALIAPAVVSSPVAAQIPSDAFTTNTALTAAQRDAVATYIAPRVEAIVGSDVSALDRAKNDLISPYRRETSRTFRRAYSDALSPRLAEALRGDTLALVSRLAILRVLGEVASDAANAALIQQLQSPLPAARYAAATALQESMTAVRENLHAYANERQSEVEVARALRERLATEADANVVLALANASAALSTPTVAIEALAQGLQGQIMALREGGSVERIDALRVGVESMQDRYIDTIGRAEGPEAQRPIVETAALSLLLITRHGADGAIEEGERETYRRAAYAAENLLNVILGRGEGGGAQGTPVATAFGAGRFDDAREALTANWLLAEGPIYSNAAWGLKPGDLEARFDQ